MFEYVLMIFGINIENKILAHFLTGLTLSIFSVLSLRSLLLIQIKDDFGLLFTKILCFIIYFSNLLSYLWIKLKSKEILELNTQLKKQRSRGERPVLGQLEVRAKNYHIRVVKLRKTTIYLQNFAN